MVIFKEDFVDIDLGKALFYEAKTAQILLFYHCFQRFFSTKDILFSTVWTDQILRCSHLINYIWQMPKKSKCNLSNFERS